MALTQTAASALAAVKANPRLRWGIWAIVCILWLYGLLVLREEVQKKTEAYHAVQKKITRVRGALTQTEWPSRLEAARAMRLDIEGRLWREGTIGLAQAAFQDWLGQAVQQAALSKASVTVAAQEEAGGEDKGGASPGLWKVSAKLSFDFSPKSFYAFLTRLATHEKTVTVESLTVRGAPAPRAELVVVAHFQKPRQESEAP